MAVDCNSEVEYDLLPVEKVTKVVDYQKKKHVNVARQPLVCLDGLRLIYV